MVRTFGQKRLAPLLVGFARRFEVNHILRVVDQNVHLSHFPLEVIRILPFGQTHESAK
jgi:hypothetical protein